MMEIDEILSLFRHDSFRYTKYNTDRLEELIMTYLNELFLDTLGCDYSKESVYRAVMACNAEYEPRMTEVSGKELRDFWEVYREFDEGGPNAIAPLIIASCRA